MIELFMSWFMIDGFSGVIVLSLGDGMLRGVVIVISFGDGLGVIVISLHSFFFVYDEYAEIGVTYDGLRDRVLTI